MHVSVELLDRSVLLLLFVVFSTAFRGEGSPCHAIDFCAIEVSAFVDFPTVHGTSPVSPDGLSLLLYETSLLPDRQSHYAINAFEN